MNLNYQHLLPENFSPVSRIWIYQSSRLFSISEALQIEEFLNEFIQNWQSHGRPVKGAVRLFFGQFIILLADETQTTVGGCSIDSSVQRIKEIEKKFEVSLFDRNLIAFVINDKIERLPLSQVRYAFENGFLTEETCFFNNLVQSKMELESQWIIPIKNSWLAKRFLLNPVKESVQMRK